MTSQSVTSGIMTQSAPRTNEFKRFTRVFLGRGLVTFGLVIIVIFFILAIFAPQIAPHNPYKPNLNEILTQPNSTYWLGTDEAGRDLLSRVIYGSRFSLIIGLSVSAVAAVTGMFLGLLAGYFGGWTFNIIMRTTDALMSFPMILEALIIAAMLGSGIRNVIIALSVGLFPSYVRLMCAQVLNVKENDYIMAQRSIGSSNFRIMLRHIVPNSFPPLVVMFTMMLGATILAESSLTYLGVGIDPLLPSWGSMISSGHEDLIVNPLLSVVPGVALMLVVFGFNMVGDGLRDALDPRLRGTL
jgi:peptide/nickel transport system permease protein